MFRSLIFAAALLFAVPSFAQEKNPCANLAEATRDLSSMQVQTLLESCRDSASAAKISELASPEKASQWAEAAKGFSEAIGIAAKELGIAANDFLDSPAGYLLAIILLFNYAGDTILSIFVGLPFSLLTLYGWFYIVRAAARTDVKYEFVPVLWGLFRRRRVVEEDWEWGDAAGLWALGVGFGVAVLNVIVWANIS